MNHRHQLSKDLQDLMTRAMSLDELLARTEDDPLTYDLVKQIYDHSSDIDDLATSIASDVSYLRDKV